MTVAGGGDGRRGADAAEGDGATGRTIIATYHEAEDRIAAEALAAAVRHEERVLFRSVEWDGPPPAAGDVLLASFGAYVLTSVAYGAGLGHYRLEARPARTIRWTGNRPERA